MTNRWRSPLSRHTWFVVLAAITITLCAAAIGLAVNLSLSLPATLAIVVVVVLTLRRPEYFAYCAVVIAFTVFPQSVPYVTYVGGAQIYNYEPFLLLAFGWSLVRYHAHRSAVLVALVGMLIAGIWSLWGLASGHGFSFVNLDVRPLLDVLLAIPVVASLASAGKLMTTWIVLTAVLWVSALITLYSSLTGFELAGREEAAALNVGAASSSEATRYLTTSVDLASIVLCSLVAVSLVYGLRPAWLVAGIPAFVIVFFAFSRNTLLGLAASVLVAVTWSALEHRLKWVVLRLLVLSAAGVAVFVATQLFPVLTVSSGWLKAQADAVSSRILGGISSTSLSNDPSASYRSLEISYLLPAVADSPFVGYGFGFAYKPPLGFGLNYFTVAGRYFAHEYYLWLAVKLGVPASALLLLSWLQFIPAAFARRTSLGLGLTSGLFASLIISLVAPMPNGEPGALVVGGLVGALCVGTSSLALSPGSSASPDALQSGTQEARTILRE